MDLILFYGNGTTFRFHKVRNLNIVDGTVQFDYFGESTQMHRTATFTNVVGISRESSEEKNDLPKIGE